MKKMLIYLPLVLYGLIQPAESRAQAEEAKQLALNIEKLTQLRQVLKNMKTGYQILRGGYNQISSLAKGNYQLHKTFLDGLYAVSPGVSKYRRIKDIITCQKQLVNEIKSSKERLRASEHFNTEELQYLGNVYSGLVKQGMRNLGELKGVILPGKLRMSDDERIKAIDRIYAEMEQKLAFLHHFNNQATILEAQRKKEKNDIKTSKALHGIDNKKR